MRLPQPTRSSPTSVNLPYLSVSPARSARKTPGRDDSLDATAEMIILVMLINMISRGQR